jgi:hypothetical protein
VEILILQVFVSLMLVGGSLLLFVHGMRQRDHEHADRLSLLPVEEEDAPATPDPEERREPTQP